MPPIRGLLGRLQRRESGQAGSGEGRKFFEHLHPDTSILDVAVPGAWLRRFTPDGNHLLTFTRNYHAVSLFNFRVRDTPRDQAHPIGKDNAFDHFFELKYEKVLTSGAEILNRDFSLFTQDGKFIIVGITAPSAGGAMLNQPSGIFGAIPSLEDITLVVINTATGEVCDRRVFKGDLISLSHNSGVHLLGNMLVVLSVFRQEILFFHLRETGVLVELKGVGKFCYEDDELRLSEHQQKIDAFQAQLDRVRRIPTSSSSSSSTSSASTTTTSSSSSSSSSSASLSSLPSPAFGFGTVVGAFGSTSQTNQMFSSINLEALTPSVVPFIQTLPHSLPDLSQEQEQILSPIPSLKHRILAFLYRQALTSQNPGESLRHFYFNFTQFESLAMARFQILDESHLLIRYQNPETLTAKQQSSDISVQAAFFVIYNFVTTEVLGIYDNSSEHFLNLFEDHFDYFRLDSIFGRTNLMTSCANNLFVREQSQRHQHAIRIPKNGGRSCSVKRILSSLPFNSQSFFDSPYFDQSIFHFDEKVVSSSDRPKISADYPIRFYSRADGSLKFKMQMGSSSRSNRNKKYASFLFHPHYPFAIVIQQSLVAPATFHFYVRKSDIWFGNDL